MPQRILHPCTHACKYVFTATSKKLMQQITVIKYNEGFKNAHTYTRILSRRYTHTVMPTHIRIVFAYVHTHISINRNKRAQEYNN